MQESFKQSLVYILRRARLIEFAEKLAYVRGLQSTWRENRRFKAEQPDTPVPPTWLMWDAYRSTNVLHYFQGGQLHAELMSHHIRPHLALRSTQFKDNTYRVLEWGCGPARILRHLTALKGEYPLELYGTDYNTDSIRWCQGAVTDINFETNDLAPPLPFQDAFFDVVYCLSVFTHLSEAQHYAWITEIERVLKPGGIFMGTFHGENSRSKLRNSERLLYDAGQPIFRGEVKEGSRLYTAYHPPTFVREVLLRNFQHAEPKDVDDVYNLQQTLWLAQKADR